ncbi:hypothetical protein H4R18_000816 [Coemansia javaensis]|uniref:Uncharacterized protein n=1 Tax=Coemansia javaensis TaxID=2761396 RepID=A0A9W8HES7_9FUNG|nr:hypothetical protein H4R18_000816 [Coemansia javaensis]
MKESADGTALPPLTWRSWLVLALFAAATLCVIRPVAFSVALPGLPSLGRLRVNIDNKLAPWLVILVLVASTAIRVQREVVDGFVGGDGIEPYAIVILIFALAYICISLDESGLLSCVAMVVACRWGRNGRVLLMCFYLLSIAMAVLTNNDVAVLCLTPIICAFSDATGIGAEPFLTAMFVAANTASMALFIGNPTNIVVAQANGVSFLSYTAWMGLPFLAAAAAGALALYVLSLRTVARAIPAGLDLRPRDMIRSKWRVAVGVFVLVSCLVALSVSSIHGVAVWMVTLPFGVAMLVADAAIDLCTAPVVKRLPYGIVPFSLGMFIIVECLGTQGWTPRLAWVLRRMCPSATAAVFVIGAVSTVVCNVLNNLPATILFSRAFQHPVFFAHTDDRTRRGAMFALVVGSNLGANFSLVGSLAGLMFQGIAMQKGRRIGYFRFMRACAPTMVVQLAVSCAVLAAELAIKR